ncbi:hypothetical protein [Pelagibius marinus]|uniref:EF-Tu C-terminal domain-related protein n=1 Tax=Pelagibius marinus TaxID=2762760 RepID=UPI00346019A8
MVSSQSNADIAARLRLLTAEEGGRPAPIEANYRPRFYIGEFSSDIAIKWISGSGKMNPGDEADTTIVFASPENVASCLTIGAKFELKEGSRTVATGMITDVWRRSC